jgi:prevent-host-death family protein
MVIDHGNVDLVETIAISKFKAKCLSVLQRVKRTGKPVLVTRFGKPIAEIVAPSGRAQAHAWIGSFQSRGRILGDIVSPAADESDWEVLRT